jgi:hypothetical protein
MFASQRRTPELQTAATEATSGNADFCSLIDLKPRYFTVINMKHSPKSFSLAAQTPMTLSTVFGLPSLRKSDHCGIRLKMPLSCNPPVFLKSLGFGVHRDQCVKDSLSLDR